MTRVIVVGGGNAALCAAIGARERGAEVLLLERAPFEQRGGNSRFTAGGMRFAYEGNEEIRALVPELTPEETARTDFGSYPREAFYDDMGRTTAYRTDPELAGKLIDESFDTLRWMAGHGVRFLPMYGRQSFDTDGRARFWGGLTIEAWGGGQGLVDSLYTIAGRLGVDIRYGARARALAVKKGKVRGVRLANQEIAADSVVLACGGFESNAAWRAQYLGPGWELAKVRGTRFNTGDGIRMALEAGAASRGNWSGCHAVAWDMHAPDFGELDVGDSFQKHSYPLGVMLNAEGRRFVDEGADFRNYTYAKYGGEILRQPGQFAWQVFDAKVAPLLRDEYRIRRVTKVSADSLEELTRKLDGVDAHQALHTLQEFNRAVDRAAPFDPAAKDGRATRDIDPPKSNWANPLDTPPFEAYGVTCGITFTFGGLHVDSNARIISEDGLPIAGLYAAGELVGGVFYFNYPGGTGLTSGAVFGRTAGYSATSLTKKSQNR
ncbi:MAG: FAD-dependent tricarballylate dehydrogenase TcuA [Gammaproteobacteria bacterium]|nr:FAD-dependent tricarballylate dehydrogenase TcuA [Gammaproteobacteria bacterium]